MNFNPVPKPNHKRGKPKKRSASRFSEKVVKEIFERDNYCCVKCGNHYIQSLPHHIQFRSQGGLGIKRNGVTICVECHTSAHRKDDIRRWFEQWRDLWLDQDGNLKGD